MVKSILQISKNDSFSDYIELAKILVGKYMFQVIIKNTVLMYWIY